MSPTFPLYGSSAARQLDARATEQLGGDGYLLMRRAGLAAWQYLLLHWPQAQRIVVVCGPGNNGGDGYVLAQLARRSGRSVQVVHLRSHLPRSELAQRACTEYIAAGGQVELFRTALPPADVVVDGLFGIGFTRAPDPESSALIEAINAQAAPVLALDVPSGVDADTGAAPAIAVVADRTLQFIARHAGLYTGGALECTGALDLDALEVPVASFEQVAISAELLGTDALALWLPPRRRNTHKGESGRVLCVGGDHGSGGAILLCAEAALRSGTGLLSVATRAAHVAALLARRPEAMVRAVESEQDLPPLLERADCIALGPGLGQGEWSRAVFRLAMEAGKPLVIDADGLNLLAATPKLLHDAVLTPHPGEAARLLDTDAGDVQRNRFAAAQRIADRFGAAVVLKGAGTIIAAPGHTPRLLEAGNPGMAVGGMGDVLTGVIAALRGQGLKAFDAACAGALLHSLAGDAAAWDGQRGLLPSDLMPQLRRLANP
jgi:ADP-dependent NAD(P)H-hydrate dehydratase / NAD(P)H-hydrate epimerase